MNLKRFIGDKRFYKMVFCIAIPIMIQNGITNFVGMLDNIMVGQVGTEQMSGVAIVNQLMFVFNICIFGAVSGAGIFCAQFYGSGNHEGVRETVRFKIYSCIILIILAFFIFVGFGERLIQLYLHDGGSGMDKAATLQYGTTYLLILLISIVPFSISQIYASTLRETGETILPMMAGIVAVILNLIINYLLIFGKFGMPQLGVVGAAIGTVISKFVECAIVVLGTHKNSEKNKFAVGLYRSFHISKHLTKQMFMKGTPLLVNEAMWSLGMAFLTQCYSMRGLDVVAGLNISNTLTNVFNIGFVALGGAISIIVGQLLGAGKMEEAKDTNKKLIFFSVCFCAVLGGIMILGSFLFPRLYNTTDEVRVLARNFIIVAGYSLPIHAFMHACYFTLRSGGKTITTFFFDSGFMWLISIPMAYALSRYTLIPAVFMYFTIQTLDLIKCVVGGYLVKKGVWIRKIID
ncbi:MAG: MATE family efflux transporter [Lachnospiraceae bacterium]